MRFRRQSRASRGFTLFELLIVVAIIGIMALIVAPNFLRLVQRSKLTGIAQETSILMRLARQYSIRYNTPAVVRADLGNGQVIAFVDVDGPALGDDPDSIFNPVAGQPHRATDFEIGRYTLPSRVTFDAPPADADGPVTGFSDIAGERVAVFLPNGSVDEEGAIRFADPFGNYLEARVAPQFTGRVHVRKYNDDDDAWYHRNEAGKPWEWY